MSQPGTIRRPRSLLAGIRRLTLAVLVVTTLVLCGPATAEAHHTNVGIDSVTCTGKVTFTVEAWDGGVTSPERTNPGVTISYRLKGESKWSQLPKSYALSSDNDFRASDSFQIPAANAGTVQLMASPNKPWADKAPPDPPSQARESVAQPIPTCPPPPTPRAAPAPSPPAPSVYRRFLPWLVAAALVVAAVRLLMNLRRGLLTGSEVRPRWLSPFLVPAGGTSVALTSALVGVVWGVALTMLLLKT